MHRYIEHNNIAYNNNNYLSVIHYEPCVKRSLLCVSSLCITSLLHSSNLSLNKAAFNSCLYIY